MKIILTQNKYADVDDEDYTNLCKHKWFAVKYYDTFYAKAHINNKTVHMHRFIFNTEREVDHINGNGLDNRKLNLRSSTHQQNSFNSRKTLGVSSIYKGVSWDRVNSKWRAVIMLDGKQRSLGRFTDETDAAKAYNEEAVKLFGEFALLNKINS